MFHLSSPIFSLNHFLFPHMQSNIMSNCLAISLSLCIWQHHSALLVWLCAADNFRSHASHFIIHSSWRWNHFQPQCLFHPSDAEMRSAIRLKSTRTETYSGNPKKKPCLNSVIFFTGSFTNRLVKNRFSQWMSCVVECFGFWTTRSKSHVVGDHCATVYLSCLSS